MSGLPHAFWSSPISKNSGLRVRKQVSSGFICVSTVPPTPPLNRFCMTSASPFTYSPLCVERKGDGIPLSLLLYRLLLVLGGSFAVGTLGLYVFCLDFWEPRQFLSNCTRSIPVLGFWALDALCSFSSWISASTSDLSLGLPQLHCVCLSSLSVFPYISPEVWPPGLPHCFPSGAHMLLFLLVSSTTPGSRNLPCH